MFEFRRPVYLILDPKLAKKLAVKDFDHFTDHRVVLDENIDKLFGKSLFSLQGQKWRGEKVLSNQYKNFNSREQAKPFYLKKETTQNKILIIIIGFPLFECVFYVS